jgi:hypothetical protein
MPNRFTAVPQRPAPALSSRMSPVVAVGDLFMALMLSRPGGLSLRNAWVTPATLWLASLFAPAALIVAALLLIRGGWLSLVAAIALVAIAMGSAAVVTVGAVQRRTPR